MIQREWVLAGLLLLGAVRAGWGQEWVEPMRQVHQRFQGQRGTFAQFGDSITVTMAFWAPLPQAHRNVPPEMERAFQIVQGYMLPGCWQKWKGPEYGSQGGMTVRWAYENIAQWLKNLNPEVALIMFGTNDLHTLEWEEYYIKLREVVQRCLNNGTVVILSTIPPRHGFEQKAEKFVQAIRKVAQQLRVPLIDFYAEILKRRPKDWDGALEAFKSYEGYDVPTLIARDGIHPSHPQKYQNDYSAEALNHCGYSLRNYLTLLKYAEVIEKVLKAERKPSGHLSSHPSWPSWFPKAPPLPPPRGGVIRVTTEEELLSAVDRVKSGETILIAEGHYFLPRSLNIRTSNITLRGETGRRERVILDGGKHRLGELLTITHCSGVTIADLTVQNVMWNGIKLNSDTGVHRVTIYNCILHNIWQRAVKGVRVPQEKLEKERPRSCRIRYCLFYNDRPKTFDDDPTDTPQTFNGNYIGGIDVMFPKGWIISDNVFVNLQGRTREGRGAIFLWHDAQDCLVERNLIMDCDVGIALGNSYRPPDITVHCTRVIVRNNFIVRCPESGIVADYTRHCQILHNTIHDPENRLGRLIRLVHNNEGLLVANNLLNGPPIRNESPSPIKFLGNLEKVFADAFVNPDQGDLRITPRATEAIDRAIPLPQGQKDIVGRRRGPKPDIGAYELP